MKRVVLIDDSELVLDLVSGALEDAGIEVIALEAPDRDRVSAEGPPDLIILDINMPQMYGDDVVSYFRDACGIEAPIYLFSDIAEDELAERATRVGATGYVWKGKGIEHVIQKILQILETLELPRLSEQGPE